MIKAFESWKETTVVQYNKIIGFTLVIIVLFSKDLIKIIINIQDFCKYVYDNINKERMSVIIQ